MWILALFLFAFATGQSFVSLQTQAQSSALEPSLIETLNEESASSDLAGIHVYSRHLIQLLVGNSAGPSFAASLTDRLARAEFTARRGKRKLISEADIAHAFNTLMKETGAPDSLAANIDTVHSNRVAFESSLPVLISQRVNGSYCNPGEAVFVLEMMIENVGRSPTQIPYPAPKSFVAAISPPVRRHLQQFCASHSRSEVTEVFDHLFDVAQIGNQKWRDK
jgi:hypothetical protein